MDNEINKFKNYLAEANKMIEDIAKNIDRMERMKEEAIKTQSKLQQKLNDYIQLKELKKNKGNDTVNRKANE